MREDISEFSDVLTQQKFDSLRRKAEFLGVDVTETQEYKKLKGLSSILDLKLIYFFCFAQICCDLCCFCFVVVFFVATKLLFLAI